MNRNILLLAGTALLVLGFLGAPLCWHEEGVLPNLAMRLLVWLSASAGVLFLWLAIPSENDPLGGRAESARLPSGPMHAA